MIIEPVEDADTKTNERPSDISSHDEEPKGQEKENNNTELENFSPKKSIKKTIFRGVAVASFLADLLYVYFLFIAIRTATDYEKEEMNLTNNTWNTVFIILDTVLAVLGTIGELTVVNPIEEIEEIFSEKTILIDKSCESRSIQLFTNFNHAVANTTYVVSAAAIAVVIAYISPSTIVKWGFGIPTTIFGVVYFNLLLRSKINNHSSEFIHRLLCNNESMVINATKSIAQSFEISIQVLVNSVSRGIIYGYTLDQILKEFFGAGDENENDETRFCLILYIAAATCYISLYSRTLNVHKQFLNVNFEKISSERLKTTKLSRFGLFVDFIMTSIRAGSVSILVNKYGPNRLDVNIGLTASLGTFLMLHGLVVRYKRRLYQTALDDDLIQSVFEEQGSERLFNKNIPPEKLFELVSMRLKTDNLKRIVTVINVGGRLASWFSFMGILITMNKLTESYFDVSLDFYDLLCIQQLLSTPGLENDVSFYQDSMVDNFSYYRTKLHFERTMSHFGVKSIVKSKSDYPISYLESVLPINSNSNNKFMTPHFDLKNGTKKAKQKPRPDSTTVRFNPEKHINAEPTHSDNLGPPI